mmetsp:Transcript_17704/g.44960  ORF Transcript_17704/g.44960 Transcript_17704/m.44960 type:complete len:426 (+) Transcript_17704:170-1447(+)
MHRKSVLSSTPWAWQRKSLHQECTAPSKRSAPSAPGRNTSSPSSPPQTPSFPRTLPTPSSLSASSPSTQCALRLPTSASPPGRSFTAHSTSPAILLAPPAQKYTRMSNLVSAGRGMPTASRPATSDQHSSATGATESTYRASAACGLWPRCPGIPRRSRSASSTPPSNSKPPTAPWPMPSEMQPPLPPQHTALRLSGKQKKPLSYSITSSEMCTVRRISSEQAARTSRTLRATMHMLAYASTFADAAITFRASDMQLIMHSDTSYLSESESRSRLGGVPRRLRAGSDPLKQRARRPRHRHDLLPRLLRPPSRIRRCLRQRAARHQHPPHPRRARIPSRGDAPHHRQLDRARRHHRLESPPADEGSGHAVHVAQRTARPRHLRRHLETRPLQHRRLPLQGPLRRSSPRDAESCTVTAPHTCCERVC